jgi:hypothetical protein
MWERGRKKEEKGPIVFGYRYDDDMGWAVQKGGLWFAESMADGDRVRKGEGGNEGGL